MYKEHPCLNCQRPTRNPKFCSASCAAKVNNKQPKRTKQPKFCKKCGVQTGLGGRAPTTCLDCNFNYVDWSTVTLGDMRKKLPTYQVHSRIRSQSRSSYRKANPDYITQCARCSYNKFTEICHIKSVSEFTNETPISVINDPSNLIQLCRNCHWEADHSVSDGGLEPQTPKVL